MGLQMIIAGAIPFRLDTIPALGTFLAALDKVSLAKVFFLRPDDVA